MAITYMRPGGRMSQMTIHAGTVYVAGQIADDSGADTAGQTKQILDKLDNLLMEAGTDKSHLLSAIVWLADINDFSKMNSVWDSWVRPGHAPVRACVEARLASPDWKVEIMVVAALPD